MSLSIFIHFSFQFFLSVFFLLLWFLVIYVLLKAACFFVLKMRVVLSHDRLLRYWDA